MELWKFLIEITAVLALGAVLGTLAERLGSSALIGYLLAGLMLGPGGLGLVETEQVSPVAEIGVALLLFTIGLEFSLGGLRRLGRTALRAGLLQVALSAVVIAALAMLIGLTPRQGLVLGAVLCLSSTAAVLRLLQERTELDTVTGRTSLGILLTQDIAVVPLVLMVTLLGEAGGARELASGAGTAVASAIALLAALLVAARLLFPRFLAHAALTRNRELSILTAVVICLAATWGAHALGVSPALGAFVAGLLLAETPFATQIRADVGSLKALFVALFFVGVGMLARLEWFARYAAIVPAAIAAILLVKAILIVLVLRLLRVPLRHAVATGVALCQVGEFGFVLLQVSGRFELLPAEVSEVLLLAVFGSLLLTPLLLPLGYPLGVRIERWARGRGASAPEAARAPEDRPGPRDRVIVVGYGPVGQGVAGSVRLSGLPVLVVDANPRVLDLARESDLPAMVGDATYAEILHHARLKEARALIVTVPDHPTALAVLRLARSIAPDVPVVVRARYHRFADEFAREGATQVYDEEGSAGESMAALVQTCLRGVCGR